METKDYIRIEAALHFLAEHGDRQPTLGDVAAHVGLSEHHLQRMFTRWAGISPKRFLQFQTVETAKALLRDSRSVLDTTYASGLSSCGRLHDLFVTLEAMTPGEFKLGASGLTIRTGLHDTPFGECVIAVTDRGVCGLTFVVNGDRDTAFREIEARWPGAEFVSDQEGTHAVAGRVFEAWTDDGRTAESIPSEATVSAAPLSILVRGTNFQVRVWEALLRIPPGTVATYDDIAAAVGQPGATRAVGTAIGRNPVAYLIPCHRVIRKTGLFGGYHWGASRKVAMLLRENPNDGGRHEDAERLPARATASGVVDAAAAPRVGRQRAFALG